MSFPFKYTIPGVRAQEFVGSGSSTPSTKKSSEQGNIAPIDVRQSEKRSELLNLDGLTPLQKAKRIPIWNRVERRKIAGTAAPLRRNLEKYLQRNPQCDIFVGQTKNSSTSGELHPMRGNPGVEPQRVMMWSSTKKYRLTGNACPLPKNLGYYLAQNPGMELYRGQDSHWNPEALEGGNSHQGDTKNSKSEMREAKNFQAISEVGNTATFNGSEPESEIEKSSRLPRHVFVETHELVPENYWITETDNKIRHLVSLNRSKSPSPKSSAEIDTQSYDPRAFDDRAIHEWETGSEAITDETYEEIISSWSKLPLWTNPEYPVSLAIQGDFKTPMDADHLLDASLLGDDLMCLSSELQGWTIKGKDEICSVGNTLANIPALEEDLSMGVYVLSDDPKESSMNENN